MFYACYGFVTKRPPVEEDNVNEILELPIQAYDWVYGNYGFIGVMVALLLVVLTIFGTFVWFDRRK